LAEADPAKLAIHRGDLALASGKLTDAGTWYNADSADARAARAILNRFNRGPVEAFRGLERVSRELPENGLVHYHLGAIETQVPRDIETQVQALERAVQLLPNFGPGHLELARVYSISGNAAKALPHITRAIQLSPELADRIYEIRSEIHTEMGEFDEAFRVVDIADKLPHGDRAAAQRFSLRAGNVRRKIEAARRDLEDKRLQEIRRDVAAIVQEREPPPAPTPPPPPIPDGQITYEIQARTPIEVVETVFPDYPEALRKAGTAGRLALRVDVGVDGKVTTAAIAESQVPALNAATLDAMKKWTFKAQRAASIRVTINFLLQ
jgi:TonB family protein